MSLHLKNLLKYLWWRAAFSLSLFLIKLFLFAKSFCWFLNFIAILGLRDILYNNTTPMCFLISLQVNGLKSKYSFPFWSAFAIRVFMLVYKVHFLINLFVKKYLNYYIGVLEQFRLFFSIKSQFRYFLF